MYDEATVDVWFNQTTLHPLGIIAVLLLGMATLVVPRRYALVPALVLVCFVAPAQRIVLATLDFDFLRIMVFFGWTRVLLRGEMSGFRWKRLDTLVVAWAGCATVTATILFGTVAVFITRLGMLYEAIGIYFLCRFLVRDWQDLLSFARAAAVISSPVALAFLIEKATGRNLFAFFGGVPEQTIVRAERLRCQGPFLHSILAGSFWAALLPLIGALWWSRGWNRPLAVAGAACSAWIVIACASATPIGGVLFGIVAAAIFPFRRHMRWVRWSALAGLVALQLVMVNPVWHLLARVPLVAGSTGWYRYKLIDEFIRHTGDWLLVGTRSYTSWPGPGFKAITNEFVRQGVDGGAMTLLLFVAMIVAAFFGVGRLLRAASQRRYRVVGSSEDGSRVLLRATDHGPDHAVRLALAWALGVSLFIHCVVFIGVSYYGQVLLVWYLGLGFIGSLTPLPARRARRVPEAEPTSSPAGRRRLRKRGERAPVQLVPA
ncbi:MAG: hypothetical protein ACYTGE_14265 [Planctomycetota bacterium]|jgi:hypothetical protein